MFAIFIYFMIETGTGTGSNLQLDGRIRIRAMDPDPHPWFYQTCMAKLTHSVLLRLTLQ